MTIKNQFDGAEREFRIDRKNVSILEGVLGRSAFAVLKEFTAGHWRFDDLAVVLSFGLYGPPPDLRRLDNMNKQAGRLGIQTAGVYPYSPHPDVVKTMHAEGHGNFADLGAAILSDVIFGATNGES